MRGACVVGVAGLCVAASAAFGQAGNFQGPFFGTFNTAGSDGAFVNMNRDSVGGPVNNTIGLQLFGDWSYSMPRNDSAATVYSYSALKFDVAPLPIRVSNFQFTYNAKWVNGGGNGTLPATGISLNAAIKEQLGNVTNPDTDPTVLGLGVLDSQNGNGLKILNNTSTAGSSNPILAVGRTYYLYISDYTSITLSGFNANTPSVTVTNEFGGALSTPTFTGFNANFGYTVVPSPGTAALLGLAGLCAVRRRPQGRGPGG